MIPSLALLTLGSHLPRTPQTIDSKPILLVCSKEVLSAERDEVRQREGQLPKLKDGTELRLVERPTFRLVVEEAMLPDRFAASVREVYAAFRDLNDPLAPFDPRDPKRAALAAWISPYGDAEEVRNAPNVRFVASTTLTLTSGGRELRVPMENSPDLPNDAFPTRAETTAVKPVPPQDKVEIPQYQRHVYVLDEVVRLPDELAIHSDVARYLEGEWKRAFEKLREERKDLDEAFEAERRKRGPAELPKTGAAFGDLDARTRHRAENLIADAWKQNGFESREEAMTWMNGARVGDVRTRPYAVYGGWTNGVQTTFLTGVIWP